MINKETIQRIMDATRIEEVIGDFVSLRKRGANHIGCCPFHNEKTPSFYVSPSKGIYKCFGCGKSGNAVGFLMEHEKYTYPEALHYLAQKYHIEIVEEKLTEEQVARQNERDGLFHLSEFAQKYFADLLYNDEMGRAVGLAYFHHRGMSDEIIKSFGLGYCLDKWANFTDHARRNGYSDAMLEKTGLTIFRDDGKSYDRFRGRVMFPIYSISGRVLGFSGRVLSSEKQAAKYVNSPDSDIYNKGHILYGLYQAKNAISRENKCYLVEGNVDVVSMHQSGVANTVASCGTSLTVEQIRLIKRYTPNVTVLYDGDSAGIKAALRAVNLLFEEGMHVRVVLFPDGEDPDSYAQKHGSTKLQEYLAEHEENFVSFKTRVLVDDLKRDPIRKAEVVKEIVSTIALVPDILERQEYLKQTAYKLQVPEQTLIQELTRIQASMARKAYNEEERRKNQETQTAEPSPEPPQPYPPDAPVWNDDTGNDDSYYPETPTQAAPPQYLPESNPSEPQERKIVSLLLNYGSHEVPQDGEDEQGNPFTIMMRVADVIVEEVTANEITFENHVYQQIFDLYRQAVENGGPLPDANHFAMSNDTGIRNMALTLMMQTYTLSELWYDRKNISIPSIESHLRADLEQSILTLKQKKIDRLLQQNAYELRSCTNEDDQTILMAQRNELNKIWLTICTQLKRVIV